MMLDFVNRFLDSSDFIPRRRCGHWTSELIWLHVGSDLLIWLAYLMIPCLLLYFTRRRRDLPFRWMFWLFCGFIVTCGFTHLFDAMAFLWPAYRLMGMAKLVTAVVSWATVGGLIPVIPMALLLKGQAELQREIDDRKRAEEALRRKDDYLRLLIDGVQDYAIFMLDGQGYVASWNSGAGRILGYQFEEIVGEHCSRFHPPENLVAERPAMQLRIAANEGRHEEEGWRVRKDGTRFWASVIVTPLRDDRDQLTGFAKIVRDVSGRKRADDEAEARTQREHVMKLEAANKELEAFSYSVSHDLRAPLRAIDGFSRILLEDFGHAFPQAATEYLHLVRNNAQQMGRLVDALLAFARLNRQPINKQAIDMQRLVRRCLDKLRGEHEGRRVELSVDVLPMANAEPTLLEQVWMNLLANAIKYTRYREVTKIEIGVIKEDGSDAEPVYFVKDNGVGFDMRYINKLFGVFQRLHRSEDFEGTGVGLATVQRIVERHGGRVWAESEVDKGATFFFSLGPGEPK